MRKPITRCILCKFFFFYLLYLSVVGSIICFCLNASFDVNQTNIKTIAKRYRTTNKKKIAANEIFFVLLLFVALPFSLLIDCEYIFIGPRMPLDIVYVIMSHCFFLLLLIGFVTLPLSPLTVNVQYLFFYQLIFKMLLMEFNSNKWHFYQFYFFFYFIAFNRKIMCQY